MDRQVLVAIGPGGPPSRLLALCLGSERQYLLAVPGFARVGSTPFLRSNVAHKARFLNRF